MRTVSIILSLALAAVLVLGAVTAASADGGTLRIMTGQRGASLRSTPENLGSRNKINSIHADTTLDVLSEQNGWYLVCYRGQYGWVVSDPELVTVIGYTEE